MIARLILFAALATLFAVPAAEAAPSKSESYDVLYLTESRPVVVRMQIASDGKPLEEGWGHFVDLLFAKLDADKNGTLDDKEQTKLRPMLQLISADTTRRLAGLTPTGKAMNRADLAEYLKKNDFTALRLPPAAQQQMGRPRIRRGGFPTPDELDKRLLELLDTNKDGKLSVKEFEAGIEILTKLDGDENELISMEELLGRMQSPFFVQEFDGTNNQLQASAGVELLPIARKGTDPNLAKRMLARYGPKPMGGGETSTSPQPTTGRIRPPAVPSAPESTAKRLTKKETKLSDEIFAALDQDGDDELDMEELARFGQNAMPDVEVVLRLGKLTGGAKPAEVLLAGKSPLKAFTGTRKEIAIDLPGLRLDLMPAPVMPVPPPAEGDKVRSRLHNTYLSRFRIFDRDANGYLDMNEASSDFIFNDLFTLLDKDGDGKIFEKELIAAIDEVEDLADAASSGFVSVDLNEAGRGLFGLIDADGDSRLSVRELRAMPKLVERFDSNKDGSLAISEIPKRFEASFASGIVAGRGQQQQFVRFGQQTGPTRPPAGPMWFQKMDRNRDGDVSRREFLGSDEEFRKLDTDGDGLISVQEAEAATK